MTYIKIFFLSICLSVAMSGFAQQHAAYSFHVVPLGVEGGINESNLSSYMLAVHGTDNYVCLDAGTLHAGLEKACSYDLFTQQPTDVLKTKVKGYLISHPHLDHVAGLIINSPDDSSKNIYALPFCLSVLEHNYFTWKSWANFGDSGDAPQLKKYHYVSLQENKETSLEQTEMYVQPFLLSHSNPSQSTAFLVRHDSSYLLYLGDTGADSIERSDKLQQLWQHIAPLIIAKQLKAIFIEVSYPNSQPANKLFGHLTPNLLMQEMKSLAVLCGTNAIKNLPVVITHMKPSGNNEQTIKKEVVTLNSLQLKIIFPQQGLALNF